MFKRLIRFLQWNGILQGCCTLKDFVDYYGCTEAEHDILQYSVDNHLVKSYVSRVNENTLHIVHTTHDLLRILKLYRKNTKEQS